MARLSSPYRSGWQGLVRILLLSPLLVSCSALNLTYSTADWILLWKLDSYFDLSSSQKKPLSRQINALHAWHRQHEIPRYIQFLDQIDQFWRDGLNQAELEILFASVERFRLDLAQHTSSPGAVFLSTVTPAQIRHLQDVLDQEQQRLVSDIGQESGVRVKRRIASTLQTLTSWLGEFSVDQEAQIRQWIEEIPDTTDVWLAHRKNRQDQLLKLIRSFPDLQTLEQDLYHWLADPQAGATAEYLAASSEWREHVKRVALDIDGILTRGQRTHFSKELQRIIQDMTRLAG